MTLNTTPDNLTAGRLPTAGEMLTAGGKGGSGGLTLNIIIEARHLHLYGLRTIGLHFNTYFPTTRGDHLVLSH